MIAMATPGEAEDPFQGITTQPPWRRRFPVFEGTREGGGACFGTAACLFVLLVLFALLGRWEKRGGEWITKGFGWISCGSFVSFCDFRGFWFSLLGWTWCDLTRRFRPSLTFWFDLKLWLSDLFELRDLIKQNLTWCFNLIWFSEIWRRSLMPWFDLI